MAKGTGGGGRSAKAPSAAVARRLVDLSACIDHLEATGDLLRVRTEVDPRHELAGVAKRLEGGKPVLFERVRGGDVPVLAGLLWNRDIVGSIFGLPKDEVPFRIAAAIASWREQPDRYAGRLLDRAPANEVVEPGPDLSRLPIPVHALEDGGRYFDAAIVMARNPRTGRANISIHRMMVTRKDRLTFLIDPGRHLGEYVAVAEERGERLPVTINVGVGLAPWIVSSLPRLGDDKHEIASHLVGRPIDLVRARTVDVPAYACAQFVVEAEILPNVREDEAPFAEVTGYYGGRDRRWVMQVRAITRRAKPVFHTVLSGAEVWNAVGFTAEAAIFSAVRKSIPEVVAVYLPHGGCGFYEAVVQVGARRPGLGAEVIRETFRAFRSLQRVVVVDADVDLRDAIDVDWAITTRFKAETGLVVMPGEEGHILNPVVKIAADCKSGTVTKVGIDATVPLDDDPKKFERVRFKPVDLSRYTIRSSRPVRARR
ncbi:MAG: UbiD family decarboxylase [Burkholderiales bacterium]|nr:UbiD family decarboxylase [Burkholderiales bacterium]